jgi:hypothetical protein
MMMLKIQGAMFSRHFVKYHHGNASGDITNPTVVVMEGQYLSLSYYFHTLLKCTSVRILHIFQTCHHEVLQNHALNTQKLVTRLTVRVAALLTLLLTDS